MTFLKSAWFSILLGVLDKILHYLDEKDVIHIESFSPEK